MFLVVLVVVHQEDLAMAGQQHQQQDFRQGLQHLALRQQEDSEHQQGALVPQLQIPLAHSLWEAQAALEAYLQHRE
jgi:hypothetical protein